MIVLGVILLIVGAVFGIGLLEVVGVVLALCGAVLWLTHTSGPVRGHWY